MIQVVLIGSGNLAHHLISILVQNQNIDLVQVFSRQKQNVSKFLDSQKITDNLEELVKADVYILAISDDAIASVSAQLPFENRLVVHTAGGVSMNSLDKKNRRGVFYPLQTFSKNTPIDFSEITICLESETDSDYVILEKTAQVFSNKILKINTEQRKALHTSAVFVNNFVNHLYQIGNEICIENNLSFEILKPLILETAHKINSVSPIEAQTGPAIRNDFQTIESHLNILKNENHKSIYKTLTQSIEQHGKKL